MLSFFELTQINNCLHNDQRFWRDFLKIHQKYLLNFVINNSRISVTRQSTYSRQRKKTKYWNIQVPTNWLLNKQCPRIHVYLKERESQVIRPLFIKKIKFNLVSKPYKRRPSNAQNVQTSQEKNDIIISTYW